MFCMRRASLLLAIAAVGTVLIAPEVAAQASASINAIGLVDYARKPTFKVGDWVRYRMQGRSELGVSNNYTLTLLVAGEEDFWGDPSFWIETWVDAEGEPPQTRASLMSYDIFGDSLAIQRLQLYVRKMITTLNDDGTPKIDINKPAAGALKQRHEVQNPTRFTIDTLGVDTVQTPKAMFKATKLAFHQGSAVTKAVGDSSVYSEVRENRTSWYTMEVPITHLAREDVESIDARKTWMIGRSGDAAVLNIRDRGLGSARLVDYGHGLQARLVPARLRHSLAEQATAERPAARPRATPAARRH